jgi:NADPH2:quinone reductase
MTAVAIDGKGGPEVLQPVTLPLPAPGPGEILIKVAAAGVNRPDVAQRLGHYPPPAGHSPLPGLEASGTVAAVGAGNGRWKVGDRVVALLNGGGYAEYAIADDTAALPCPPGLSDVEAAGVPETTFTVWNMVFDRVGLQAGEWFLVHGGTSGIGTTAIQLAKAFGAKVIATAGSDAKCAVCRDLGADVAVNYRTEDFVAIAKQATGGHGIDVTLDMVGGSYADKHVIAAAVDGRIAQIATQQGAESTINLARLMMKRLTLTGATLRARSREDKARFARDIEAKVWPLFAAGKLKVLVDSTFPLRDAADAHRRIEAGDHVGKIILTMN